MDWDWDLRISEMKGISARRSRVILGQQSLYPERGIVGVAYDERFQVIAAIRILLSVSGLGAFWRRQSD